MMQLLERFDVLLAEMAQEFPCTVCAVSWQEDCKWAVHGLPHSWIKPELLQRSKLFKLLVNRAAPTVVPDASEAKHLSKDCLVSGGPEFRFYAEMPFRGPDGKIVGALILADRRRLDEMPPMNFDLSWGARAGAVVEHTLPRLLGRPQWPVQTQCKADSSESMASTVCSEACPQKSDFHCTTGSNSQASTLA
eukprot:TRINITY_DN2973_c0_g1_i5.p1 TRINITY_DN2973_c0_g1~~TRINITY_DN2973_c0_g1_i5.p1  ORF type:complete len:192 (+),score=40.10 TRINITY_DN2973_c0_g1_i5:53-628(+)